MTALRWITFAFAIAAVTFHPLEGKFWSDWRHFGKPPENLQSSIGQVFEKYASSVARVVCFCKVADGDVLETRVSSGFFIGKTDMLITACGVVDDAQQIIIECGALSSEADVVTKDPVSGLCVLQPQEKFDLQNGIDFTVERRNALPSPTTLLLAIMCLTDSYPSPRLGMVTGKNISFGNTYFPTHYLRSDIATCGGMPGAPVFDLNGSCIGMVSASIPQIGECFLIPFNAISRVVSDILAHGRVRYVHIGIRAQLNRDERECCSIEVASIIPDSPASHSPIQVGDRLLAFNGTELHSIGDLCDAIFYSRPDGPIPIILARENEILSFTICPMER
ncbi:MAG: S1C family serine protease [Puniceicoccales bacterium]|jgi:serine protease Do|nr:S1C family serine protease [Puniceicoccales bacterium]